MKSPQTHSIRREPLMNVRKVLSLGGVMRERHERPLNYWKNISSFFPCWVMHHSFLTSSHLLGFFSSVSAKIHVEDNKTQQGTFQYRSNFIIYTIHPLLSSTASILATSWAESQGKMSRRGEGRESKVVRKGGWWLWIPERMMEESFYWDWEFPTRTQSHTVSLSYQVSKGEQVKES